jgi:hypothetical protein
VEYQSTALIRNLGNANLRSESRSTSGLNAQTAQAEEYSGTFSSILRRGGFALLPEKKGEKRQADHTA